MDGLALALVAVIIAYGWWKSLTPPRAPRMRDQEDKSPKINSKGGTA